MTRSELINAVIDKILSGGRRTTAANVRSLVTDLLNSYISSEDDRLFDAGPCDITGSNEFDITNVDTIPDTALLTSISLISSNAAETLNIFYDLPANQPLRFFPSTGLIVTIEHGTGSSEVRCSGGISINIDGDKDEWFEITNQNGVLCMTNYGKYSFT